MRNKKLHPRVKVKTKPLKIVGLVPYLDTVETINDFLLMCVNIFDFRLFSDGGNFSPEEVDTHKKKLEKLANKIDSAEGFVMADLEGMETRRLEQATEIANKFEDR